MNPPISLRLPILATSVLLGACQAIETPKPESERLQRAIEIAMEASSKARSTGEGYRITHAQETLKDGRYVWVVTFKPTALLPDDPATSPVGLGGQVFVNVDLENGKSTILYGQ